MVRGIHPPDGEKALGVSRGVSDAAEHPHDLVAAVRLVASGHRSMGGEDQPFHDLGPGAVPIAAGGEVLTQQLERGEGRMSLVQVIDGRTDAQRLQGTGAPDPEHRVLREPDRAAAFVEAGRDPPPHDRILRTIGVEQEQRDASDVDAPDLHGDGFVVDRDLDRDPRAGRGVGHRHACERSWVGVGPVLMLPTAGVDALVEVAGAIEQPDA